MVKKDILPAHCRAARGLLRLKAEDLAALAGVARATFTAWELGRYNANQRFIDALCEALAGLGLEWGIDDEGRCYVSAPAVAIHDAENIHKAAGAMMEKFNNAMLATPRRWPRDLEKLDALLTEKQAAKPKPKRGD